MDESGHSVMRCSPHQARSYFSRNLQAVSVIFVWLDSLSIIGAAVLDHLITLCVILVNTLKRPTVDEFPSNLDHLRTAVLKPAPRTSRVRGLSEEQRSGQVEVEM